MHALINAALLALALVAPPSEDPRLITNGWIIPDEGYCDQPYVVVLPDGAWLCTLTTGPGEEGSPQQHVVATRSLDEGRSWSPLINIEPPGPPESSWVMPLLTDYGRVYVFYLHNTDNLREVIAANDYARRRVDTLGHYMCRYSDDGGLSWSERFEIPIREFEIDRDNPYGGKVRFFWGVGKPVAHDGVAWIGLSKVGSFGAGFIERSEGFFLRSDNIMQERDPAKLHWETLPKGDIGLRAPLGPIAEEQNLTWLDSGALYCTYRTTEGHPCHAYSQDGGYTWTPPEYMSYTPGGRLLKHPRAANFVRRLSNGRFLYWFHNHGGTTYQGRNPAWLSAGKEIDGRIHWSQPEIVLYAEEPDLRMSYPDFVETPNGLYITETQKSVARVHCVEDKLLQALFAQGKVAYATEDGLAGNSLPEESALPDRALPRFPWIDGLSAELEFSFSAAIPGPQYLLSISEGIHSVLMAVMDREGMIKLKFFTMMAGENDLEISTGLVWSHKPHHLIVLVDTNADVMSVMLDGELLDGGTISPQGWLRLKNKPRLLVDAQTERASPPVRIYNRCLSVSEAVANYRHFAANSEQ